MPFKTDELLTCVAMASMPATLLWGLVSARMHAKPWLMMALAVLVMAGAALFQLIVSTQPVASPPLHDLTAKLKIVQLTWISVALGMGGALMGSAVAAQAAQQHALAVQRVEVATASAAEGVRESKKEMAAWRGSASASSEVERRVASAERRFTWYVHQFVELQRDRERLGLKRLGVP